MFIKATIVGVSPLLCNKFTDAAAQAVPAPPAGQETQHSQNHPAGGRMNAAQAWHRRYAAATAPISQRQPTPEQQQSLLALRPVAQAEDWPVERYCNAVRSIMGLVPLDLHTPWDQLPGRVA